MNVHPTVVVHPGAEVAPEVDIAPYSVIGPRVRISEGCRIDNHVTITGRTTIGPHCRIHTGAVVGGLPQDLKYRGEDTELVIGSHNTIREFVTVNSGTVASGGRTVIGDHNLLMAYVHVAHDCALGNHIVLANLATLGGHIRIEDGARISGLAAVHHFVRIGRLAFVGGCAKVVQDVPPFTMADGNPARIRGLNLEGLKRVGMDREAIEVLKEAYRLLYRSDLNRSQAIAELKTRGLADHPAASELIRFVRDTERGRSGRAREALRMNAREAGPPAGRRASEKDV